jgi:hypothetical protein
LHTTKSKSACAGFDLDAVRRSLPIGANQFESKDFAEPVHKARRLPFHHYRRGAQMETFFVRKQIIIGAAFLAAVELTLMLVNVLRHAH